MKNYQKTLTKKACGITQKIIEKAVINSANTTSSFLAHQPVAPEKINKYKK